MLLLTALTLLALPQEPPAQPDEPEFVSQVPS
jgi:hypothetical protein